MIQADTNLLSTFARVEALGLLWELFPDDSLCVTPAIYREIIEAIAQGCGWLNEIPMLIKDGQIKLVTPTSGEVLAAEALSDSLGPGEWKR